MRSKLCAYVGIAGKVSGPKSSSESESAAGTGFFWGTGAAPVFDFFFLNPLKIPETYDRMDGSGIATACGIGAATANRICV